MFCKQALVNFVGYFCYLLIRCKLIAKPFCILEPFIIFSLSFFSVTLVFHPVGRLDKSPLLEAQLLPKSAICDFRGCLIFNSRVTVHWHVSVCGCSWSQRLHYSTLFYYRAILQFESFCKKVLLLAQYRDITDSELFFGWEKWFVIQLEVWWVAPIVWNPSVLYCTTVLYSTPLFL